MRLPRARPHRSRCRAHTCCDFAASDGDLSAFDTVTIDVDPAPPPVNLPPIVNAGVDQSITLPVNQVQLAGSASDDGQPVGSIVTIQWSKESGPGTVTFGNTSSLTSTATFDQPGSYVLRLSATDGVHAPFDTMTVLVNPPTNQAPLVNAGADHMVTLPASDVALSGAANDDGLPAGNGLTFRWSVISGPTVPVFGDALTRETIATFAVAGTYVLRLTVTDGDRSAFDELIVIVNPGAPPPPVNQNPAANAGGPYTGDATTPLGLTAAASTDPDGDALTYAWTFGDGQTGTGRTPTHTWAAGGHIRSARDRERWPRRIRNARSRKRRSVRRSIARRRVCKCARRLACCPVSSSWRPPKPQTTSPS